MTVDMAVYSTVRFQFDDLYLQARSWGYGKARLFVMVDCIREITSKKSYKYDECGFFEHLLFMFSHNLFITGELQNEADKIVPH